MKQIGVTQLGEECKKVNVIVLVNLGWVHASVLSYLLVFLNCVTLVEVVEAHFPIYSPS